MRLPTRALVLVPHFKRRIAGERSGANLHSSEDKLAEATGLAQAIELEVVEAVLIGVGSPRPATLFGSGKVDEIALQVVTDEIGLVIVDHALSPIQQRNLERAWKCKVLDRTGLILEIFGARARTKEGRLQVELAHLSYQRSRLVRTWTHLERQRGGYGFLGGPGEAQIELDRRMIGDRIDAIRRELDVVVKTRALHRAGRARVPYPVVAIVGYTNAGKSTLFNRLTGSDVLAQDQVFATLDPTMREVQLQAGRKVILSDTVGFIAELPTALVAAFRATLEEVIAADLILHVRDISHPGAEAQARDVEDVLGDLGIDLQSAEGPVLEVWNKVDALSSGERENLLARARFDEGRPVVVSAISGEGLPQLLSVIEEHLGRKDEVIDLVVPSQDGKLVNWLHENSDVLERSVDGDGSTVLKVRVGKDVLGRLFAILREKGLARVMKGTGNDESRWD